MKKNNRTEFGIELAKILVERNLLVKEAAEEIGVKPEYLSDASFGRRNPTPELVQKIAKSFGLAPWDEHKLYLTAGSSLKGSVTVMVDELDVNQKLMLFTFLDKLKDLTPGQLEGIGKVLMQEEPEPEGETEVIDLRDAGGKKDATRIRRAVEKDSGK